MTADTKNSTEGPEAESLSLAVVRGPDCGLSARFFQDRVVLGRKKGDLVVGDRETSSTHACVERAPGGRFLLKDLDSTNGTFLDGRRITVVELNSGQQFRCGANTFLFCEGEMKLDADATVGPPDMAPEPPKVQDGRTTDVSPLGRLAGESVKARHAPTATGEVPLSKAQTSAPKAQTSAPKAQTSAPKAQTSAPLAPAGTGLPVDAVLIPPMGSSAAQAPARPPAESASPETTERPLPAGVERSSLGAYLLALEGRDEGKVFSLQFPEVMIGRADTHVRLSDPDVSRRHARLELEAGGVGTLRDLASTNGTMLNGTACLEGRVVDGDRIRVGDTVLELILSDSRLATRLLTLKA